MANLLSADDEHKILASAQAELRHLIGSSGKAAAQMVAATMVLKGILQMATTVADQLAQTASDFEQIEAQSASLVSQAGDFNTAHETEITTLQTELAAAIDDGKSKQAILDAIAPSLARLTAAKDGLATTLSGALTVVAGTASTSPSSAPDAAPEQPAPVTETPSAPIVTPTSEPFPLPEDYVFPDPPLTLASAAPLTEPVVASDMAVPPATDSWTTATATLPDPTAIPGTATTLPTDTLPPPSPALSEPDAQVAA